MPGRLTPASLRPAAWRRPLDRAARRTDLAAVAAGAALFAAAAVEARRLRVIRNEERVFRSLNDLPDGLHRPVWGVMQSGSLASVGVVAGAAALSRRPVTAVGLASSGFAMWGGAKLVKRQIGRGRPSAHIDDVAVRGHPQTGLGFPSGHAAVSVTLAAVAAPALGPRWRWAAWTAAGLTAAARMYVGAHLPLDVVGGIGLGAAAGGLTNLVLGDRAGR